MDDIADLPGSVSRNFALIHHLDLRAKAIQETLKPKRRKMFADARQFNETTTQNPETSENNQKDIEKDSTNSEAEASASQLFSEIVELQQIQQSCLKSRLAIIEETFALLRFNEKTLKAEYLGQASEDSNYTESPAPEVRADRERRNSVRRDIGEELYADLTSSDPDTKKRDNKRRPKKSSPGSDLSGQKACSTQSRSTSASSTKKQKTTRRSSSSTSESQTPKAHNTSPHAPLALYMNQLPNAAARRNGLPAHSPAAAEPVVLAFS